MKRKKKGPDIFSCCCIDHFQLSECQGLCTSEAKRNLIEPLIALKVWDPTKALEDCIKSGIAMLQNKETFPKDLWESEWFVKMDNTASGKKAGSPYVVEANIPEEWRNIETFFQVIANQRGIVRRFSYEGEYIYESNPMKMSVKEYLEWWKGYVFGYEVFYLTDIDCPKSLYRHWKFCSLQNSLLQDRGLLDLHAWARHYIGKPKDKEALFASLRGLLYICPPMCHLGTKPHFDGVGNSMSLHTMIYGPKDSFNLVTIYDKDSPALREILGIEKENLLKLPYAYNNNWKCDPGYLKGWKRTEVKECVDAGLEKPFTFRLLPGQSVVLPPGRPHAFKKCSTQSGNLGRTCHDLMVSLACDSFYGSLREEELKYCLRQAYTTNLLNVGHALNHSYCSLEIVMALLTSGSIRLPRKTPVHPILKRYHDIVRKWYSTSSDIIWESVADKEIHVMYHLNGSMQCVQCGALCPWFSWQKNAHSLVVGRKGDIFLARCLTCGPNKDFKYLVKLEWNKE